MFKVHLGRLWDVSGAYGLGLWPKSVAVRKHDESKEGLVVTRSIVNAAEHFRF